MNFSDFQLRDLRLTILKSLAAQGNFTLNEKSLQVEAGQFGLNFSRAVIRTELDFLQRLGAVTLKELGSVIVATLRQRGHDHVKGLARLDGVEPPSPEF